MAPTNLPSPYNPSMTGGVLLPGTTSSAPPPPLGGYGAGTAVDPEFLARIPPISEVGRTGLRRYQADRAYLDEEALPTLRSPAERVRIYTEMADNEAVIGASLRVIDLMVRRIEWRVEPFDDTPDGRFRAEHVEGCMNDMHLPWVETIAEAMSMLQYGWAILEQVMKVRQGRMRGQPKRTSKYDDGLVGWGGWPIRAQTGFNGWVYDAEHNLAGLRHLAPPDWADVVIPSWKSLHFKTTSRRESPEGMAVLRPVFQSYWYAKKLREVEGVGLERDLAGLPVVWLPPSYLSRNATADEVAVRNALDTLVRNVRRDAQEGMLFPLQYDANGNKVFDFTLMSSPGSRQLDIGGVIARYEQRMAQVLLTTFLLLGQTGSTGSSFALSADQTNLFADALEAYTRMMAEVINRDAVTMLMDLNGWPPEEAPKIVPGDVNQATLSEIGNFISILANVGAPLFPNRELEDHLYKLAGLPEPTEEVREEQQEQKDLSQLQQFGYDPLTGLPSAMVGQQFGPPGPGQPFGGEEEEPAPEEAPPGGGPVPRTALGQDGTGRPEPSERDARARRRQRTTERAEPAYKASPLPARHRPGGPRFTAGRPRRSFALGVPGGVHRGG